MGHMSAEQRKKLSERMKEVYRLKKESGIPYRQKTPKPVKAKTKYKTTKGEIMHIPLEAVPVPNAPRPPYRRRMNGNEPIERLATLMIEVWAALERKRNEGN